MAWYVDTSAFVKLVVREPESDAFRDWASRPGRQLFSSDLLRTEVLRAAKRLSRQALAEARSRLGVLTIVQLDTRTFEWAGDLDPAILRSLDALHLAAAMSIDADLQGIATYDARLADAAARYGIAVTAPT